MVWKGLENLVVGHHHGAVIVDAEETPELPKWKTELTGKMLAKGRSRRGRVSSCHSQLSS